MIIIDITQKSNRIDQKTYDKYTTPAMIRKYMNLINIVCFTIHGYYTRNVVDNVTGDLRSITIVRIKIGNKTHALLLTPMVPYSPYTHNDITSISLDDIVPDDCTISEYVRYYIKKTFRSAGRDYKAICSKFITPLFIELLN